MFQCRKEPYYTILIDRQTYGPGIIHFHFFWESAFWCCHSFARQQTDISVVFVRLNSLTRYEYARSIHAHDGHQRMGCVEIKSLLLVSVRKIIIGSNSLSGFSLLNTNFLRSTDILVISYCNYDFCVFYRIVRSFHKLCDHVMVIN